MGHPRQKEVQLKEGRTDEWTDRFPLLPLIINHILLKQGTGTADHLLGCYFIFFLNYMATTTLPTQNTRHAVHYAS